MLSDIQLAAFPKTRLISSSIFETFKVRTSQTHNSIVIIPGLSIRRILVLSELTETEGVCGALTILSFQRY